MCAPKCCAVSTTLFYNNIMYMKNKKDKAFIPVLGLVGLGVVAFVATLGAHQIVGYQTDDPFSIITHHEGAYTVTQTVESNCLVVESTRTINSDGTLSLLGHKATISDSENCIDVRFDEIG
jgi:D-arabinose 1-dehydrogenase-like Zn-dependent alcohol dehydrogenase